MPTHLVARFIILALGLGIALGCPRAARAAARDLSDAERAAVEYSADYLARGPEAFYERLSSKSPLLKLSRDEALAEIEVRAGSPQLASWRLQTVVPSMKDSTAVFGIDFPSGVDETLIVKLERERNEYKIRSISVLAEPVRELPEPSGAHDAPSANPPDHRSLLVIGVLGFLLSLTGTVILDKARRLARLAFAGAAGLFLAGIAVAVVAHDEFLPRDAAVSVAPRDGSHRLGSIVQLRREITTGESSTTFRAPRARGLARDAAVLWNAQRMFQQMDIDGVKRVLARFPEPSNIPLVEILRARLATFRSKEADAVVSYERAINLGPGRDGLWYETAQALFLLGFDERAKSYLKRLERIGSREADVYYTRAVLSAIENRDEDAESSLLAGWTLQPALRSDLVRAGALWKTIRRPRVTAEIKLNLAHEPTVKSAKISKSPITTPVGVEARVSGEYLEFQIGEQELAVPGGARIAPAGAKIVNAADWNRTEEQKALSDLPSLLRSSTSAGAFTQPAMRARIERTAVALASHNRWTELLALTESISPKADNIPFEVLFLRGTALQRVDKKHDAKTLFARMAANPVIRRRKDPESMLRLAEALASVDYYAPAIKLYETASSLREVPFADDRIRQLSLDQRLSTAFMQHRTEHFEIRYPSDTSRFVAVEIGRILESELKRIGTLVPVTSFKPVSVNLLPWQEFRSTYTGSDHILAFYNGKITLPLATAGEFVPEIVAIISHELAHAMIAQATGDQAPRWFQEGLAQRIEMTRYSPNAFNMYDDDKLLSIAILDSILRGSPDPDVIAEAYIVAQTMVRYIEASYGTGAIKTMIAAFQRGANTEEALSQISSKSVGDFDTSFRIWGRAASRVFENPEPIHYNLQPGALRYRTQPAPQEDEPESVEYDGEGAD